jgi:hypothetical protein
MIQSEGGSRVNRRSFLTTAASLAAASALPKRVEAQAAPPSAERSASRQAPAVRTRGPGGFSPERIARLRSAMNVYTERGDVPGIAWAVARRNEIHWGVHGVQAVGGDAMRRDSIFRIALILTSPR